MEEGFVRLDGIAVLSLRGSIEEGEARGRAVLDEVFEVVVCFVNSLVGLTEAAYFWVAGTAAPLAEEWAWFSFCDVVNDDCGFTCPL